MDLQPIGVDAVYLAALAISIATISSVFVELIKQLFIDPRFPDSPQRTAALRALSYALNLGLLLLILGLAGKLNGNDVLIYLLIAFGQWGGSHAIQQTFSWSNTASAGRATSGSGADGQREAN